MSVGKCMQIVVNKLAEKTNFRSNSNNYERVPSIRK